MQTPLKDAGMQTGNDRGNSAGVMRVLVADQEPEMLEAIARAFEVDVATSKATCIDLLRANTFDVIVACERLTDGSGLELLSQVGQRWPHVIRILALEPARRALLQGRLEPFKLFETLSYPIDEEKFEAALARAAEAIAAAEGDPAEEEEPAPAPARTAPAPRGTPLPSRPAPQTSRPAPSGPASRPAAAPASRAAVAPASRPASPAAKRRMQPPAPGQSVKAAGGTPGYPPLPAKGSKIVPLGSPVAPQHRIVPLSYPQYPASGRSSRVQREPPKKSLTLHEKAAALAAEVMAAIVRYIRPQPPTRTPPRAAPRKKR